MRKRLVLVSSLVVVIFMLVFAQSAAQTNPTPDYNATATQIIAMATLTRMALPYTAVPATDLAQTQIAVQATRTAIAITRANRLCSSRQPRILFN